MKQIKRISLLLVAFTILIQLFFSTESHADEELITELEEMTIGIIDWKKSQLEISSNDNLLNNQFLENAGLSSGDWFPLGIGRLGVEDDYAAYLAMIDENIIQRYKNKTKLDRVKATEWHRIALAVLAVGGDPTAIGSDNSIDLIADGTYNRSKVMDIGEQGINGLTWGLLTLDSLRYKIPNDAPDTREDLIERILAAQLEDGGFPLKIPPSNIDITGMSLQALAPYYHSEKTYKYTRTSDQTKREVRVRDVVDEALEFLTNQELANTESIVQVMVALSALQIDPLSMEFTKDNKNLLELLKHYEQADGGLVHSNTYDEENPTSSPDESNSMASEQALYGLTSMLRYYTDSRSLYDFREEMSAELLAEIRNVEDEINRALKQADKSALEGAYDNYLNIPAEERSYVGNYAQLSDALIDANIKVEIDDLDEAMEINSSGNGTVTHLIGESDNEQKETVFTENDAKRTEELMKDKSTEFDVEVIKLLGILKVAENKADYQTELTLLEDKKIEIDELTAEIESLNQLIMKELYPFEAITSKDKAIVRQIFEEYNELAPYDQTKVQNYEDVEKAETQINNLQRANILELVGVGIVIILVVYLIYRRNKRKQIKLKQNMLDEN